MTLFVLQLCETMLCVIQFIGGLPSSAFRNVPPWLDTEVSEGGRGFLEYSSPEITFSPGLLIIMHVAISIAVPSKAVFIAAFCGFLCQIHTIPTLHAFWYVNNLPRLYAK